MLQSSSLRCTPIVILSRTVVALCLSVMLLQAAVALAQPTGFTVAWGANYYGECNVPAPNADFVAVSAGYVHNLGLKSDGSVDAWWANPHSESAIPTPNTGFVAVAAAWNHSLGLKADGSVVAWGNNFDGQCDVPAPNTGFTAVTGGQVHSLGLKADGSIVAWGSNYGPGGGGDYFGQCDVPEPNTGFVAVAGGSFHSLGLKTDGSIVAWGNNGSGQCNVPAPNTDFVAVSGGGVHSLGLKADGSIVAWGYNVYGQCNVPAPNAGFVAVAGGDHHSLGLKADGSIVAWGYNNFGQCNVPAPNTDFVAVSGGYRHSLGLKNENPVPVKLLSFTVQRHGSDAVVHWQVGEQTNHAGFHVYRSEGAGPRIKLTTVVLSNQSHYEFVDTDAPTGGLEYWLAEVSRTGAVTWYGPATLLRAEASAVTRPIRVYPNPARAGASIQFNTTTAGPVAIQILDPAGRLIRDIPERTYGPGEHIWQWDNRDQTGTPVKAGTYFFLVTTSEARRSGKIAVIY